VYLEICWFFQPLMTLEPRFTVLLGIDRFAPVNDRFSFERSTGTVLRLFFGGLGACQHLLDTVEK
jgi:hypothetical protein